MARAHAIAPLAVALACALPFEAGAQGHGLQPEVRAEVLGPSPYRWQPAAGLTMPLGYYARVTALAAYAPEADTRYLENHWRGDLLFRVLLDPFRQQRWALSVGGGLSVRKTTYLAAVLDLEGPQTGGVMPALEVGVSGGFRASVVLRRAVQGRR